MHLPLRPGLVPALGFLVTFCAAAFLSTTSGSEARAMVHAAAGSYAAAVSEGRTEDVLRVHADRGSDVLQIELQRAAALRGALWLVSGVDPGDDGRYVAHVVWFRGDRGAEEDQVWERAADGSWRLWGWLEGRR